MLTAKFRRHSKRRFRIDRSECVFVSLFKSSTPIVPEMIYKSNGSMYLHIRPKNNDHIIQFIIDIVHVFHTPLNILNAFPHYLEFFWCFIFNMNRLNSFLYGNRGNNISIEHFRVNLWTTSVLLILQALHGDTLND